MADRDCLPSDRSASAISYEALERCRKDRPSMVESNGSVAGVPAASCGPVMNPLPYVPRLVSLSNHFLDLPDADLNRKDDRPFNLLTNFSPKTSVGYELKK